METFIVILVLVAIVAISAGLSRARTSGRNASNAQVRTSLTMISTRSPGELADIIARGLAGAGLRESGSFDGTRFFRLNNVTQLELRVWAPDSQSRARLHLPAVRAGAAGYPAAGAAPADLAAMINRARAGLP